MESDGQKDNAGGVAGAALQRGNSYIGAVLAYEGDNNGVGKAMRAAGEALLNSRDFFHDQSALNALEVFQAAGEAVDHSLQEAGGESAGVEFEVVALIHTEHGNGHCTPVLRRYPVQHGQDICLGLALCKHPLHPEPLLLKIMY